MILGGILRALRNVFLAGNHITMLFVASYFIYSLFTSFSLVTLISLLFALGLLIVYKKFYVEPRKAKKNLLFCYLSILLFILFIMHIFGLQISGKDPFSVVEGIFSMFIKVLGAMFLALIPFIIMIAVMLVALHFYVTSKKPHHLIFFIACAVAALSFGFLPQLVMKMDANVTRKIVMYMENLVYLLYGGMLFFNFEYLRSEEDYSLNIKIIK